MSSAAPKAPAEARFVSRDPGLLEIVLSLARRIRTAGGRTHLVGGSVRDALLGIELLDFDLEVFGLSAEELEQTLRHSHELDLVGASFGVLKLRGLPIDVALPRRESKRGRGHRGFAVDSIPDLSEREAAARRDFTINSIAFDPLDERWIDPFDGISDLQKCILRHTSERFVDDPLRVLRGMQLMARFALEPAVETLALCSSMGIESLPVERIDGEFRKLLLLGVRPALGLSFLERTGWLRFFPEIEALRNCPQDPEWHPEGDVFDHTAAVLDAYAGTRLGNQFEDLVVGFGCLCHDLGKPLTTEMIDGRWRSPRHEPEGAAPTRSLMARITREHDLVEAVVPLVEHHLKPRQLYQAKAGDAAVRRLSRKVRIDRLVRVAQADFNGRPPQPASEDPACRWLSQRAEALAVADRAPDPIIQGRHLIELGLEPGPDFGPILERVFERQLDGEFGDLEGGREVLLEESQPGRRLAD